MNDKELLKIAIEARDNAIAPFSNFRVGAALLGKSGKVYKGCNIELAVMGNSICAERCAMLSALSSGEREFTAIAVTADNDACVYPCGSCRQVLAEFCDDDFRIICANRGDRYEVHTLKDLLPKTFRLKDYKEGAK